MSVPPAFRRSVLFVLGAALFAVPLACAGGDDGEPVAAEGAVSPVDPAETPTDPADPARTEEQLRQEWEEACGDAPPETACGTTFEELRDLNLRYADRLEFTGDLDAATAAAESIRADLTALAERSPSPTEEELAAALEAYPEVLTSSAAVKAPAPAFGVWTAGGCIFGWVHQGEVVVEISGPVHDGGCLASYGH